MALGRICQHGKYSYGVWQWFAYSAENLKKWSNIEECVCVCVCVFFCLPANAPPRKGSWIWICRTHQERRRIRRRRSRNAHVTSNSNNPTLRETVIPGKLILWSDPSVRPIRPILRLSTAFVCVPVRPRAWDWGPGSMSPWAKKNQKIQTILAWRGCKAFWILLLKFVFCLFLHHIAFGRIWQHGKYSYGVCQWFVYKS
jgi:hypothetical protein